MSTSFHLRFSKTEIRRWAKRYAYGDEQVRSFVSAVRKRGYLTKPEFLEVCHWKSPRTQPRCASNSSEFIRDVTQCGLGTPSEQLRIEVLTLLSGVSYPTASVILHFFHRDRYPIIDVRALWSVHGKVPSQYHFEYWWKYTRFCRDVANKARVSMRTLDRALWQYSKERQP